MLLRRAEKGGQPSNRIFLYSRRSQFVLKPWRIDSGSPLNEPDQ